MSYKLWTPEEENRLRELVATGKYSYRQIGALMGRGINSVTCHARQYLDINNDQYDKRKYGYVADFFRVPNVVNAYIAGFLAADGNIRLNESGTFRIRLEIHVDDEHHLLWIKDQLGHEGPIQSWGDKQTRFWQLFVTPEYAQQLADNFGVIPNKTHHLSPPNLESFDTRFAYFLGLVDGDGCIHINSQDRVLVTYTSSSLVAVEWVQQIIAQMNFVQLKKKLPFKIKDLRPRANAYTFTCVGARTVALIQLAQEFARRHNLPILARKWNNPRLNQYITNFHVRFPTFEFDAGQKLDQLTKIVKLP